MGLERLVGGKYPKQINDFIETAFIFFITKDENRDKILDYLLPHGIDYKKETFYEVLEYAKIDLKYCRDYIKYNGLSEEKIISDYIDFRKDMDLYVKTRVLFENLDKLNIEK